MKALLEQQHVTTLIEWTIERIGEPNTATLIEDIVSYYDYMSLPMCEDDELLDRVFTNAEILSCLFSHLYDYVLVQCSQVCKTWHAVTKVTTSPIIKYGRDACVNVNWYHMSKALENASEFEIELCMYRVAEQGYELTIHGYDVTTRMYTYLCTSVASHSDYSKRYYDLFWKYLHNSNFMIIVNSDSDVQSDIFAPIIDSGDIKMFNLLSSMTIRKYDVMMRTILRAARNNPSMLPKLGYTEEYKRLIPDIVTESYCGDNYDEVVRFCESLDGYSPVSYETMLDIILFNELFCNMKRIVDLLEKIENKAQYYNRLLTYVHTTSCSLSEFKPLWEAIRHSSELTVFKVCALIHGKMYDIVLFLSQQEEYKASIMKSVLHEYSVSGYDREWIQKNL